jgi:hypothetical protein
MQKHLKIKSCPRQRAADLKTAGKQRSDPLCWDVSNQGHIIRGPGQEVVSGGDPSKTFMTRRETIKTIMRDSWMISQIETGGCETGREREACQKMP